MNAFVVRPFGEKEGIDFDRVHAELIAPVCLQFGVTADTTGLFAQAGNIRADMFERLMIADLVIADISIHNANVYYELGVRHALRDRKTILIRARQDDVPFDLRTDRYLEYQKDDPASARAALADAVRQTLGSDKADSPVFLLVPGLLPQDPETLVPAPPLFSEAVRQAETDADRARLRLLAEEVVSLDWAVPAWRVVGRAQMSIRHFAGARTTFEDIRERRPNDRDGNLRLATIYQRLGDLPASSAAIARALAPNESRPLPRSDRAEATALHASNLKTQWADEWRAATTDRRAAALRSGFLYDAADSYRRAFSEDQNHFYSGLNALALIVATLALTRLCPAEWAGRFDTDAAADAELAALDATRARLDAAVRQSLDAAAYRAQGSPAVDIWRELSEADYSLLTSARPTYVARKYGDARRRLAESAQAATVRFPAESAARQINLYLELGVLVENSRAALAELGVAEGANGATAAPPQPTRVVVFSGHRADAVSPPRARPRFPRGAEANVRAAIRALLEQERAEASGPVEGVAGGASGGDILFHEVCEELGIPTVVLLAVPADRYVAASVQDGGAEWVERFWRLCQRVPPEVLGNSDDLPPWLSGVRGYSIWQRNNLWTLSNALSRDSAQVTLMLLWDGQPGDGPGGTADMAMLARARGVKVLDRIDPATGTLVE